MEVSATITVAVAPDVFFSPSVSPLASHLPRQREVYLNWLPLTRELSKPRALTEGEMPSGTANL